MGTVNIIKTLSVVGLCTIMAGCTYYEIEPIKFPVPDVPNPTTTLEAVFVTSPPNKISAAYWKTADYLPVTVQNQTTGQVPADDGLFNMSGTFNGLLDFNAGKNPNVIMKAAYSSDSLYILVSWKDTTYNASQANWYYDGPTDPKKPGSTAGWTSQGNDDNLIMSFDMGAGSSDVWNWSLALSEPLGYAIDMIDDGGGAVTDAGDRTYVRNAVGDNRSGPQFDWSGVQQELYRKPAGFTILDPGYYLLNKDDYTGDVVAGDVYFQAECAGCHGVTGDGNGTTNPVFVALNGPGQFNRWTRDALDNFAPDPSQHEGSIHYPADETDRENLFARLRGFSGIPGYYLANPTGSSSDIRAVSNVQLAKIDRYNTKGYTVLLVRALNTTNADDIVFNPSTQPQYDFAVDFTNNDELNRIGSVTQQLTFKPKK
ncbi:MAG: hypothetical protein OEV74_14325 [Cyclobacteriaceae bacterium]|nr:hypothetical protein [Cyclobacteriaceae bacterium]MDH4297457.1 hypothetical protein [Cyclobacteriaceae bacterium]MDH5250666.1 hypothetical protein [Cyclobacteriaceae bacterium]